MRDCKDYLQNGVWKVQNGEEVDHCETCVQLARLDRQILEHLSDFDPPTNLRWQEETLRRIRAETKEPKEQPNRFGFRIAVGAIALACTALLFWNSSKPETLPGIRVTVTDSPAELRSSEIAPGATITFFGDFGELEFAEARLYYNGDRLLRHCSQECTHERTLELSFLAKTGRYHLVMIRSPNPIPSSSGAFDGDMKALTDQGSQVDWKVVDVR